MMMNLSNIARGLLAVAIMYGASPVSAGTYTMDWCLPGCGSATNSNGKYILLSSIGQFDATPIREDAYQLVGGFWYNHVVPQTRMLPVLLIWKAGGELWISWAPALPGCRLEQSVDSSLSDWTDAPLGNPLIVPTPETPVFFRVSTP